MKFKQYKGQKWKQNIDKLDVYINILEQLNSDYNNLYNLVFYKIDTYFTKKGDKIKLYKQANISETSFYEFLLKQRIYSYEKLSILNKNIDDILLLNDSKEKVILKFKELLHYFKSIYSSDFLGKRLQVSGYTIIEYRNSGNIGHYSIEELQSKIHILEGLKISYKHDYQKVLKFIKKKKSQNITKNNICNILGIRETTYERFLSNKKIKREILSRVVLNLNIEEDSFLKDFIVNHKNILSYKQEYKLFMRLFSLSNREKFLAKGENINKLMISLYKRIGTEKFFDYASDLFEKLYK